MISVNCINVVEIATVKHVDGTLKSKILIESEIKYYVEKYAQKPEEKK